MKITTLVATTATFLASTVTAHPGHDHSAEIAARSAYFEKGTTKRDLSHCSATLKRRGIEARNIKRRSYIAENERVKRGLKRSLESVTNTTHLSSIDHSHMSSENAIFTSNASTVLQPDVTLGPYYASGEFIRRNIVGNQEGIEMILDIQLIDVNTCEPVINSMIDFWHCNATGVYSGVVSNGNGDESDTSNLNTTFLRGLQPTQYDGVAQFTTIFPGHYTGRATHIHIITHHNGTVLDNSTYSGGSISHIGQLFFDQDLITKVEATAPYNTNTQEITENAVDQILISETADTTADPMVQYSFLGDDISDGIFAWISIGVDTTNEQSVTPAVVYSEDGGTQSSSSAFGGGGGSAPNGTFSGNGTAPTGSPPGSG